MYFSKNHDGTKLFTITMPQSTSVLTEELGVTDTQAVAIFRLIEAILPIHDDDAECELISTIATGIVIDKVPVNDVLLMCLISNLPHIIRNQIATRF